MRLHNSDGKDKFTVLVAVLFCGFFLLSDAASQTPLGNYSHHWKDRGLVLQMNLQYYPEFPLEPVAARMPGPYVAVQYAVQSFASDEETTRTLWQTQSLESVRLMEAMLPPAVPLYQIHDALLHGEKLFILEETGPFFYLRTVDLEKGAKEQVVEVAPSPSWSVLNTAFLELDNGVLHLFIEYQDLMAERKVSRYLTVKNSDGKPVQIDAQDIPEKLRIKAEKGRIMTEMPSYATIVREALRKVESLEGPGSRSDGE